MDTKNYLLKVLTTVKFYHQKISSLGLLHLTNALNDNRVGLKVILQSLFVLYLIDFDNIGMFWQSIR